MEQVVVTGLGAVSPVGIGVDAFWQSLCAGRSGIAPVTRFDASSFRNNLVGEVKDFDPAALGDGAGRLSRCHQYALAAVLEAARAADLPPEQLARTGLCGGTNFGSLEWGQRHLAAPFTGEAEDPAWWEQFRFAAGAELIASTLGLGGPAALLSLSCASGVAGMGYAADAIRWGKAPAMIAVGYDELSLYCYSGLSALRAITPDIIKPFDKNRKGTIFAEGAGALVLEAEAPARQRGAKIYARVLGHAMNNDAFHMTAPDKAGVGITAVMRTALTDAGVEPGEIDHVNAHGTGTQYNDKIETAAIKAVLGDHAREITVTANKSMMGHTCGAAGTLESICTIHTLQTGLIPPTIRYETPDPECDLDYVPNEPRHADVRTALCNAYGIGGTNAAIVLRRYAGS